MPPEEIRHIREQLGWTMRDMAHCLQVSAGAVAYWENGHSRPTQIRLALLLQLRRRVAKMTKEERRRFTARLEDIGRKKKQDDCEEWVAAWLLMRLLFTDDFEQQLQHP